MTNIATAVGDQSIVDKVFSDFQLADLSPGLQGPRATTTKSSGLESWESHYLVVSLFSVRLTDNCIQYKVEWILPMVIVSILLHVEIGRNDHREDAPHFILSKRSFLKIGLCNNEKDCFVRKWISSGRRNF